MDKFLIVFSATFITIGAIISALAVATLFLTACRRLLERFEWAVAAKTRAAVSREMIADAWWFNDKGTQLILNLYAMKVRGDTNGTDEMRRAWKAGMDEQPTISSLD